MKKTTNIIPNIQQYPKKFIIKRTPSQFVGIAKQYASAKKQRIISQNLFDQFFHQVSSLEKINQYLKKSVKKKNKQREYAESVHNRYTAELLQKLKVNQEKNRELEQLKSKANNQKSSSRFRMNKAKQRAFLTRKTSYNHTKQQLCSLKCLRTSRVSKTYEINHSRVKQIEEKKARVRENYTNFIQSYNKKYMNSYQEMINLEKESQIRYENGTINLKEELGNMKQYANRKIKQLNNINSSYDSRQTKYKLKSLDNFYSTKSLTPLEIISGNLGNVSKIDKKEGKKVEQGQ